MEDEDTHKKRQDYDSPWKEALKDYLPSFIELLFPKLYRLIDWNKGFKFQETDLRKLDVKASLGKREADALVKVFKHDQAQPVLIYIHIEVQSQVDTNFAERMFIYSYRIRDLVGQMPISLAVLCDSNKRWLPKDFSDSAWEAKINFTYPKVKLEDYRDNLGELEVSKNPFALFVAAILHANITKPNQEKRRFAKLKLFRWLHNAGLVKMEVRRLLRLIDWVMTLSPMQDEIFEQDIRTLEEETKMAYVTSWERRGIEKGIELGRAEVLAIAEQERKRAEQEAKRAEEEAKRAEQADLRAEEEARRAERLAQKLRELGIDPE